MTERKSESKSEYQKIFNETLTKMRYATAGAIMDNEPLMRALVKIMYDFSDLLKMKGIIIERTEDDDNNIQERL